VLRYHLAPLEEKRISLPTVTTLTTPQTHPPVRVNGVSRLEVVRAELPLIRPPERDYGAYIDALDALMGGLWRRYYGQPWQDAPDAKRSCQRWTSGRSRKIPPKSSGRIGCVSWTLRRSHNINVELVATLPQEVTEHPEAAIQLSNRRVHMQVRGKCRCVPTSSVESIRRKANELALEHDERRL
jgi:hypothetical protein